MTEQRILHLTSNLIIHLAILSELNIVFVFFLEKSSFSALFVGVKEEKEEIIDLAGLIWDTKSIDSYSKY